MTSALVRWLVVFSEVDPGVRAGPWLHIHTLLIIFHACALLSSSFIQLLGLCFVLLPSTSRYLYTDPLHWNMTYLFLRLLKDDLKEYTYAARLAGLVYGVASGMNAILVSNLSEVGGGHSMELLCFEAGVWGCLGFLCVSCVTGGDTPPGLRCNGLSF